MKASVIIPCKDRVLLLERAIRSIITSKNSSLVEIIVVDDCSDLPIVLAEDLQKYVQIIRLDKPSGAAVARNKGISASRGEVIYLMDSDDIIVNRDFLHDSDFAIENSCLCYSELQSQNFSSNYPSCIKIKDYFDFIFVKYQFIGQTSSLFFPKNLELSFDEKLPKHQDWDFLYTALKNDVPVKKGPGTVFFDRDDKSSISRTQNFCKSLPWLDKLRNELSEDEFEFIEFHLVSQFKKKYSFRKFLLVSIKLLIRNKLRFITLIKKLYYRLNLR